MGFETTHQSAATAWTCGYSFLSSGSGDRVTCHSVLSNGSSVTQNRVNPIAAQGIRIFTHAVSLSL